MQPPARQQAFRIALVYMILTGCGIAFSNELWPRFANGFDANLALKTIEDGGFVLLTGGLLYLALRRRLRQWEREMEQRRETEKTLRRTEWALKVLSACNGVLVRANCEATLLSEICRVIVENIGYRMGWVGFAEHDHRKSVRVAAQAGCNDGYLEQLRITWSDTSELGQGPTGRAIRTGQTVVCNNFQTDPKVAPWRAEAAKRGYASSIVLPLRTSGETIGVLNLYAAEINAFDAAEVEMLTELADDLAYGIQALRMRQEREAAEAALRASEARLQFLLTATPATIYSLRPAGDFATTFVSHNVREVLGYESEAFNHDPIFWLTHVHPDDVSAAAAGFTKLPSAGVVTREYRFRHQDGSYRWIHDEMRIVRDDRGQPQEYVGYWFDITERKRAEEQMNLQASALTATANAIIITDHTGRIEWVNPSFTRLTGYSAAEAIGGNPRMLKSGQHPPEFYSAMWAAITGGNVWHGEMVNKHKDGRLNTEATTITPVRGANGQIAHFVAVKQDVTERQQLEAQLRQSQKMDAIGRLAGGVAHDFNNILSALLMQTELLEAMEHLPVEVMDGLKQIRADANRAADLTRQLLQFGRRQVMQPRNLDLNEVVANMAKLIARIIGEDVQMRIHLHPAPLLTHADAGMIEQVLMNLVVNARDAMPEGGRLRIETAENDVDEEGARLDPETAPGRYVCISVSDTGSGIPPEVLPRIFEPFFTTKKVGKGTGLGLATVFGIVKQHAGWIKVDNQPGQGVTFRIFLPASTVTAAKAAPTEAKPKPRGGGETILLAEDEPGVRKSLRVLLERQGYQVLEAANGIEALDLWLAHRRKVALLLTDLVMPGGLNGQEVAQQLRAAQPNLKVIYTSGFSPEIAGRELQLRAGEHFVSKPFVLDELLETIRQSLDG